LTLPKPAASLVERLALAPHQSDVAIILRHAEREEIPAGTFGEEVPLNTRGVTTAEKLGSVLARRGPVSISSSPVWRCVQTAGAILRGGSQTKGTTLDWRLGAPGPFVVNAEASGELFLQVGILDIVRRQLTGTAPPPGMRDTAEGIELLLGLIANDLGQLGRLGIHVTHDSILAVLVAWLYGVPIEATIWPDYLDGLLLWQSEERLNLSWRGLPQATYPIGC